MQVTLHDDQTPSRSRARGSSRRASGPSVIRTVRPMGRCRNTAADALCGTDGRVENFDEELTQRVERFVGDMRHRTGQDQRKQEC
jgi:hypothetical protein